MKQRELIDRLVKHNNELAKNTMCAMTIEHMYIGQKVVHSAYSDDGDRSEIQSNTLAEFIDILIPPVKKEET